MNDLISKKATIDKINERQRKLIYCFGFESEIVKIMDIATSIVIAMPSALPELKCSGCIYEPYADICERCPRMWSDKYEGRKKRTNEQVD